MKKVITYGTYDLLHEGHINLLRRAKALGDYLIVGVTNDNFDRSRGKLNVQNNVLERVEAVRATGLADQIVIEDYVGQKIDDIQKYGVDIFTVGSDWVGKFDYLNEYCKVVYLPRTEGISSTQLREQSQRVVRIGVVGCGRIAQKFAMEAPFVSGVKLASVFDVDEDVANDFASKYSIGCVAHDYAELLRVVDAVYIATPNVSHFTYVKDALLAKRHVLCEIALVTNRYQAEELFKLAKTQGVVLQEALKTAHAPAFNHLMVVVKSGLIGDVVDIEASVSQLKTDRKRREMSPAQGGGCVFEMGAYPLLPIFKILGTEYQGVEFFSRFEEGVDVFSKGVVKYPNAVCSFKLGMGVKTEGSLVISGTKGYAYAPAPWWKMDYFELRYEDRNENKKFFYKFDGEGLRYELQDFISCILNGRSFSFRLNPRESIAIAGVLDAFASRVRVVDL